MPDVASLSLPARLAVALHLFTGYCRHWGLDHPELSSFVEHLWAYMQVRGDTFEAWYSRRPPLVEAGMGWDYPDGFKDYLASRGVPEAEFHRVLWATTEILYFSLFGAADDTGSLSLLNELASVATARGVRWPNLAPFASSLWVGGGGGQCLSDEELSQWRAAAPTEPGAISDRGGN
ncbi:MAG: hypothetical protein HYS12_11075 [Planctomycetes bacterium]|nr:hypothetical protein [Planctomycetota bacterium]